MAVIRPKAVPTRFSSTTSGTDGHMAAGTRTKAAPSTIMLGIGFQWVMPMTRWAGISMREPDHHQRGALADAVHQVAGEGREDHGCEDDDAGNSRRRREHVKEVVKYLGQEAARGLANQRDAPFVVEHVGGKGREGEDGAIEGDAEQDNVPVGRVELPDVGEDDFVATLRLRKREHFLAVKVHGVVDQVAEQGEQAEACRCPECDAVASEIAGDELFGVEAE